MRFMVFLKTGSQILFKILLKLSFFGRLLLPAYVSPQRAFPQHGADGHPGLGHLIVVAVVCLGVFAESDLHGGGFKRQPYRLCTGRWSLLNELPADNVGAAWPDHDRGNAGFDGVVKTGIIGVYGVNRFKQGVMGSVVRWSCRLSALFSS